MKGAPKTPVLRYAAQAPAKKIIYTKPNVLTRNPGPSMTLKQMQVPGLGLGLGF